jgi:hypothetical protein
MLCIKYKVNLWEYFKVINDYSWTNLQVKVALLVATLGEKWKRFNNSKF